MFWPPQFVPNNRVTVSDIIFAEATGLAPRFETFATDVTVLSPWWAWAVTDPAWVPDDPMLRFLVCGNPGVDILTLNRDTHGMTVILGDPPLGGYTYEVVACFPYWDQATATLLGTFCMARVRTAAEPPPELSYYTDQSIQTDADTLESTHTYAYPYSGMMCLLMLSAEHPDHLTCALDGATMTREIFGETEGEDLFFVSMYCGLFEDGDPGVLVVSSDINVDVQYAMGIVIGGGAVTGVNLGAGSDDLPALDWGADTTEGTILVGFSGSSPLTGTSGLDGDYFNEAIDPGSGPIGDILNGAGGPEASAEPPVFVYAGDAVTSYAVIIVSVTA